MMLWFTNPVLRLLLLSFNLNQIHGLAYAPNFITKIIQEDTGIVPTIAVVVDDDVSNGVVVSAAATATALLEKPKTKVMDKMMPSQRGFLGNVKQAFGFHEAETATPLATDVPQSHEGTEQLAADTTNQESNTHDASATPTAQATKSEEENNTPVADTATSRPATPAVSLLPIPPPREVHEPPRPKRYAGKVVDYDGCHWVRSCVNVHALAD